MGTSDDRSNEVSGTGSVSGVDLKLEAFVIPVADVDRAAVPRVTYTDPQAAAVSQVRKTATYTHAYAESPGFLTLLSDGE